MRTIWVKIKEFFGKIWRSLTTAGRMVIGLGALIIIVMLAFAFAKDTDEARHDHSPEIAQVLQPSIGEPLEPDIPAQNNGNPTDENSIYNRGVGPSALTFVAPASGINPDEPIRYHSDSLKFKVVLPPHAQVSEQPGGVQFTSQSSKLHYIVSVYNAEGETLPGIEAQLRNSPTAAAITKTQFAGREALRFEAKGFGTGTAFIAGGKIYYLLGNQQLFSQFQLL